MNSIQRLLLSRSGPAITGAVAGVLGAFLVFFGNPGFCFSCFTRGLTNVAAGFCGVEAVLHLRPEIPAFVLGSFLSAFSAKEFRPRGGSSPLLRLLLGFFTMVGAKIFLGCTWRAYARLAEGDWNALAGIAGVIAGVGAGVYFLRQGFTLGRAGKVSVRSGALLPLISCVLLAILLFRPVFFPASGPDMSLVSVALSVGVGLLVGWMAQKSRYCTVGAIRNLIMARDAHLLYGIIAFLIASFTMNILLDQFMPGFDNQPLEHTNHLWNFLGMLLLGLAATFAGGCPGRQFVLSGQGDGDAAVFLLGMLAGGLFSCLVPLTGLSEGVTAYGMAAVALGIIFCLAVGFLCRIRIE